MVIYRISKRLIETGQHTIPDVEILMVDSLSGQGRCRVLKAGIS